jgi:chromosomal replication initiation ATPase DnaA
VHVVTRLPQPIIDVLQRAAEHFLVTVPEVLGRERTRNVAAARHCAMFVLRDPGFRRSYPELARIFNQRDHSSAMNGVAKVDRLIAHGDERTILAVAAVRGVGAESERRSA